MIVKFLFEFFNVLVQLIQVDIRQDGRNNPALRTAAVGAVILPVLHISGVQKRPQELEKSGILDFLSNNSNQNRVVDVVKTAFDVAFDKPFCADKFVGKLGQGRVAAPSGPESMGIVREHRLINRFQYHAHYFLHQLVRESRQSQRTHFAVRFLNIGAPHRLRTVGLAS